MKNLYTRLFAFFVVFNIFYVFAEDAQFNVNVTAAKHEKLKIKLIVVGKLSKKINPIIEVIKNDLAFSGQFDVIIAKDYCKKIDTKNDITAFFSADCRLGVFFTEEKRKKTIGCRLYDLEYAQMLKGFECNPEGKNVRAWAHTISDTIWPVLTNEQGFFSTKIAYCKKINRKHKKSYKHIYVADYDGSNEELLVSTPTVNITPRWNNDPANPLVFYSEHTNENVRLMVADMNRRRKIVSNFDGLNILSTFSPDGKKFAYCASRADGHCQIYFYDGELKRLTNQGNNISPTFADEGKTLYFCSDHLTGNPQIYKYDLESGQKERISSGGFAVSTSFCPKKELLAYSKMIKGLMQIFVYNPKTGIHEQLTFNHGNKDECSWSPCGNYLLFSVEHGVKSQLAVLNLLTRNISFITPKSADCYYPCWSPMYAQFPAIT